MALRINCECLEKHLQNDGKLGIIISVVSTRHLQVLIMRVYSK